MDKLPEDIIFDIVEYLSIPETVEFLKSNKQYSKYLKSKSFWKLYFSTHSLSSKESFQAIKNMYKNKMRIPFILKLLANNLDVHDISRILAYFMMPSYQKERELIMEVIVSKGWVHRIANNVNYVTMPIVPLLLTYGARPEEKMIEAYLLSMDSTFAERIARLVIQNRIVITERLLITAIMSRNTKILKLFLNNYQGPLTNIPVEYAIINDFPSGVKILIAYGFPVSEQALSNAPRSIRKYMGSPSSPRPDRRRSRSLDRSR